MLFSFNYLHETKDDWKDIHYRICLGLTVLDTFISDYSNDWGYIRSCLERIVNHSRTVIELNYEKEPTIALWIYCTRQIAIALEWDAAFKGMNDPSGRAVKGVHEQAY